MKIVCVLHAGEALKEAARQDGIAMPDGVDSKPPGTEKLAGLHGADFDRAFARAMVQEHEEAVALFRKEAQGSGESHVKAFARTTLPTLEEHLRMARELSARDAKDAKTKPGG
jgi:putative membrane protein